MRPGRIVLVLVGLLIGLLGLGLLAGGAALSWAHSQRDEAGYFTARAGEFFTGGYAITSGVLTVESMEWVPDQFLRTVRVEVTSDQSVFVGIGRKTAVAEYLAGVPSSEVTRIEYAPFRVWYDQTDGAQVPGPPTGQGFWLASTSGAGRQELTWDLTNGDFVLVVMNTDASPLVMADLTLGIRTNVLSPIGVGLLVAGLVLGVGGTAMVVGGAAGSGSGPSRPGPAVPSGPTTPPVPPRQADRHSYPMRIDGCVDSNLSRWLWLVKWLLALPHWLILGLLWPVFGRDDQWRERDRHAP